MCGTDTAPAQGRPQTNPYQSVKDYISNVGKFKIIESTLREGEQFANAFFDTETKIKMYEYRPLALYTANRDTVPRLWTHSAST